MSVSVNGHVCAVLEDGSLWCWGPNVNGQLGLGSKTSNYEPARVRGTEWGNASHQLQVKSVSAGDKHTCAVIGGGHLSCWGSTLQGRLGLGDTSAIQDSGGVLSEPSWVRPKLWGNASHQVPVVSVSAGGEHTCAVLADGSLWCWGAGGSGQLGIGSTPFSQLEPKRVNEKFWGNASYQVPVVAVSAGADHTCAVLADGSLWCWGLRANTRLGLMRSETAGGSLGRVTSPRLVHLGSRFQEDSSHVHPAHGQRGGALGVQVSAGEAFTLVLHEGQLTLFGHFKPTFPPTPALKNKQPRPVLTLSGPHTPGSNTFAALVVAGDVAVNPAMKPIGQLLSVATGHRHSCAILEDRSLACWGSAANGRLGEGTDGAQSAAVRTPQPVRAAEWGNASHQVPVHTVAAGDAHTCAVLGDGSLWCWGAGSFGQLGLGVFTRSVVYPQRIRPAAWGNGSYQVQVISVSAGDFHTCAVLGNGSLWCWGRGYDGQLGVGGSGSLAYSEPRQVLPTAWNQSYDLHVAAVSAGSAHTCAVLVDGSMWCWGDTVAGLGLGLSGANDDVYEPRRVRADSWGGVGSSVSVTALSAGGKTTCVVLSDGSLWCFGDGTQGRLGIGGIAAKSEPTQVLATLWGNASHQTTAVSVSVGPMHTCAVLVDGSLWCWGSNNQEQLATSGHPPNGLDYVDLPHRVVQEVWGITSHQMPVLSVSAGEEHTCAVLGDRSLWCWGSNEYGQLGYSTDPPALMHVQVPLSQDAVISRCQPSVDAKANGRAANASAAVVVIGAAVHPVVAKAQACVLDQTHFHAHDHAKLPPGMVSWC